MGAFASLMESVMPAPFVSTPPPAISFSEIISALSFAVDLTEGAVPGHALRTCVLGMRLAAQVKLPSAKLPALYYSLLLKDVGCSSNAARMCQIVGGDDRVVKNAAKLADWTRPLRPRRETVKLLWREVLPKASAFRKVTRMVWIAVTQHKNNREMIELRCGRGADIVRKIGLGDDTAEAIYALDEHWNGSGYPEQLRETDIPFLARILAVAQHLDVFACEEGPEMAMRVLHERSGEWFDPELVRAAETLHRRGTLWAGCRGDDDAEAIHRLALSLEPQMTNEMAPEDIDHVCEAFADVVDAKSPFTYRHSLGVAEVAVGIARVLQLPEDRVQVIRRAALLHDLGKLSVPNTILDKTGRLSPEEWQIVSEHSRVTQQILRRIGSFEEIACIAGAHHERLDGSGYPYRMEADELTLEMRLVAVADVYSALTEHRSYRRAMSHDDAVTLLRELTPNRLDLDCVNAVVAYGDELEASAD